MDGLRFVCELLEQPHKFQGIIFEKRPLLARHFSRGMAEDFGRNLDIDLIENFLLDGYSLPGICGVEPHDVVLDLGAFSGNSSIAFSRPAGPQGTIYAFEPNPLATGENGL